MRKKRGERKDLDSVVFKERVIKGWLMRDMNTVYDISIWALHLIQAKF